ncbi:hypothetical protein Trydic_g19953 [Trypoxylus dichotomus]
MVTAVRYKYGHNIMKQELSRFPQIKQLQHGSAVSHTTFVSITALKELLPHHIMFKNGHIIRQTRSPDLSAFDFPLRNLSSDPLLNVSGTEIKNPV